MPATGDETVKLSQLKEWSDTLGGGRVPVADAARHVWRQLKRLQGALHRLGRAGARHDKDREHRG